VARAQTRQERVAGVLLKVGSSRGDEAPFRDRGEVRASLPRLLLELRVQNLLTSIPTKRSGNTRELLAFTLLEVMIAVSLFFMATFAILGLMSRSLSQARALQPMQIDANVVAAELSLTNKLEEGEIPSEIITHFEHMYPGYTCGGSITEVGTNGLFEVDLKVGGLSAGKHVVVSDNKIYLFRPMSPHKQSLIPPR
jgi:hypothetical protein